MKTIDLKTVPVESVIAEAMAVLRSGGLIIFPTETTYGAGVDATNQTAVDKLLQYKSRRQGKPLSIAVADQKMAEQYVEVNDSARKIYQRFLPGPVTVISKSKGQTARGVESEFQTLGVRIPDYQLIRDLVEKYGQPLTATSANASGKKRPYTVNDILQNLSPKQIKLIDLVLDAGQLPPNPPSTVIDTTLSTPVTMRQGSQAIINSKKNQSITTLETKSESETQQLAGKLLLKNWDQITTTGLVIGLNGPLGIGKTIFAKGAAKFLQIEDIITSPTYTYIEEYSYTRHGVSGMLYHLDLWKVDSLATFKLLEIEKLLQPKNILVIEWWNQVEKYTKAIAIKPDLVIDFTEKNNSRILKIFNNHK